MRGDSIRVLIMDARLARARHLQRALAEAGFTVVAVVDQRDDLHAVMAHQRPDAIIVDTALPSRDTLENLGQFGRHFPKPIIMLTDTAERDLTRDAARAGLSAYVVDGVAPALIRSLVGVAIAQYRFHRSSASQRVR